MYTVKNTAGNNETNQVICRPIVTVKYEGQEMHPKVLCNGNRDLSVNKKSSVVSISEAFSHYFQLKN
jgi:hypothetical protein